MESEIFPKIKAKTIYDAGQRTTTAIMRGARVDR